MTKVNMFNPIDHTLNQASAVDDDPICKGKQGTANRGLDLLVTPQCSNEYPAAQQAITPAATLGNGCSYSRGRSVLSNECHCWKQSLLNRVTT